VAVLALLVEGALVLLDRMIDPAPSIAVAEEKTSWFAPFGRNYLFITVLLLVVMALGYAGVVYGAASQSFLFLSLSRGYSAGFVFALVSWSGVVSSAVYLLNAFIGERFERRWVQLFGAVLFAGGWWGVYEVHNTAGLATFYIVQYVGEVLWLWSMYVYIPANFPTRMRSLGTGWTWAAASGVLSRPGSRSGADDRAGPRPRLRPGPAPGQGRE